MSTNPRAIVSPSIDLWCVGAASVLVIAFVLVIGIDFFIRPDLAQLLTVATLVNGAHFAASYRMLYFSRGHALRYPSASIYLPFALFIYCLVALGAAVESPPNMMWGQALLVASSLYLALHYTGQTWGMIASFGYVEQVSITPTERGLFKSSMRLFVVWQVLWAISLLHDLPPWIADPLPTLRSVSHVLAAVAALLGFGAFLSIRRRIGRRVPIRMVVPFAALCTWYLLLNRFPGALVLVQFFHALQYLIFPTRVELNRFARRGDPRAMAVRAHLTKYVGTLLATAGLVFLFVPWLLNHWDQGYGAYAQLLIASINIHHFYIDGYIWKISNPIVKGDLFAHLGGKS